MSRKIPLQWRDGRLIPVMDQQLADFPGEEWKDIPDFEGDYKVSSLGRVKSLGRYIVHKKGPEHFYPERILKIGLLTHKNAILLNVDLTNREKKRCSFSLSRLMYRVFVDAGFDMYDRSVNVKRKDEDTLNCHYENLILESAGKEHWEPVNQYDKEGKFIERYASASEAAEATGSTISSIKDALNEKFLHRKKYFWRTGDKQESIDISAWVDSKLQLNKANFRPVQRFTLNGEPLEKYESIIAAAKALGHRSVSGILTACGNKNRTSAKSKWRYIDEDPIEKATGQTNDTGEIGNNTTRKYNIPVSQYDKKGVFMHKYPSSSKAAEALGYSHGAILGAIKNKSKTTDNSYWRHSAAEPPIDVSAFTIQRERYFSATPKAVKQFTQKGELITTYSSITTAGNAINSASSAISKACKSKRGFYKGFIWRYAGTVSE